MLSNKSVLCSDDVVDGEHGEGGSVGSACVRINGLRAGGAKTAAQRVGADDKVLVGVQRLARTDIVLPPASLWVGLCGVCMRGGRETSVEQDGIGSVLVELAPGLEGDFKLWQAVAVIEGQRSRGAEQRQALGDGRRVLRLGPRQQRLVLLVEPLQAGEAHSGSSSRSRAGRHCGGSVVRHGAPEEPRGAQKTSLHSERKQTARKAKQSSCCSR